MLLVPPDSSRLEAIVRINDSLKQLHCHTNCIFTTANQRLTKCKEKIDLQLSRIDVIERKVEALEQQLDDKPVLHCSPRYPEVYDLGFYEPVFGPINILDSQHNTSNSTYDLVNYTNKVNPLKTIKEGIVRKKNVGHFIRKSQKVDDEEDALQLSVNIQKLNLRHFVSGIPNKCESIHDFSNSLLDGLENLSSLSLEKYSTNNEVVNFLENFEDSQSEANDLGELIELDLPEDLPGFDTKSLGPKSVVSNTFCNEERFSHDLSSISTNKSESEIGSKIGMDAQNEGKDVPASPIKLTPVNLLPNQILETCTNESSSVPLPPPPPPPPLQISSTKVIPSRCDLMAAIRATGGVQGAGLRNVKPDNDLKCTEQDSTKDDLMTSLTRVLAMRRRGISGIRKPASMSIGDVLREQIPTRTKSESSSEEDQNDGEVRPHEWVDE